MILVRLSDEMLLLTVQSPPGNLLDKQDITALLEQTERAATDPKIRGILLTGHGNCFVTGVDLQQIGQEPDGIEKFFELFETLLYKLFTLSKPIVAAVNGHSIGGGLLLQCCADWVCMAENPKIKVGLPEVGLGLTIDSFMHILLRYCSVSDKHLASMLLGGRYLSAKEASDAGFADAVVPAQDLLTQTKKQLDNMQGKPFEAFAQTKRQAHTVTTALLAEAIQNKSYRIFNSFLVKNI